MPRRLLRDGLIVEDDWRYWNEAAAEGVHETPPTGAGPGLIIAYADWFEDRARWRNTARLGLLLEPAQAVLPLQEDLSSLSLIAADFGSPSEGRGYSQGRLLRERLHFSGELRARGGIRRDQVFFLARCGFNAFELPESELAAARAALETFTMAYQTSNDRGLPHSLRRRR